MLIFCRNEVSEVFSEFRSVMNVSAGLVLVQSERKKFEISNFEIWTFDIFKSMNTTYLESNPTKHSLKSAFHERSV